MQQDKFLKAPSVLSLIILISFPSLGAVLITPALPQISHFFSISGGQTQHLITLFLIGYALSQLMYSPFANKYGRKVALYWGLGIYLAGCVLSLIAIALSSFSFLNFSRLIMAIGSGSGMVLTFTIVNDYYKPNEARVVLSYVVLAYGFVPAVAVFIGGLLTRYLDYRSCFYFLTFYSLIAYFAILVLPETLKNRDDRSTHPIRILTDYFKAIKSIRILIFSISYGIVGGFVYVTAGAAPFIAITVIGISASLYGILLLIPYSMQIIGAFVSAQLNKKFSSYLMMAGALFLFIFSTLFMLFAFVDKKVNLFSLFFPLCTLFFAIPFMVSNASIQAQKDYPDKATASAVMTFLAMTFTLLCMVALSYMHVKEPLTLPRVFCGITLLSIVLYIIERIFFKEEPKSSQ